MLRFLFSDDEATTTPTTEDRIPAHKNVFSFLPHTHKCPNLKCQLVWEHDPDNLLDEPAHDRAHHCPKCGTEQYYIAKGGEPASCINEGHGAVWLAASEAATV